MSETVLETPAPAVAPAPPELRPNPNADAGGGANGAGAGKTGGAGRMIGVAVLVLVAAGAGWHFLSGAEVESTDDAFTDGRSSIVSPQVAGPVASLDVGDNQFVKTGQQLARYRSPAI